MPRWGTSTEYSQHMFSWRNKKNINLIPTLIYTYGALINNKKRIQQNKNTFHTFLLSLASFVFFNLAICCSLTDVLSIHNTSTASCSLRRYLFTPTITSVIVQKNTSDTVLLFQRHIKLDISFNFSRDHLKEMSNLIVFEKGDKSFKMFVFIYN